MIMQKQAEKQIKVRNPVAKNLNINRCVKMVDRKKAAKRGYSKHRADYN
jgi:hypothetical protein